MSNPDRLRLPVFKIQYSFAQKIYSVMPSTRLTPTYVIAINPLKGELGLSEIFEEGQVIFCNVINISNIVLLRAQLKLVLGFILYLATSLQELKRGDEK